MNTWEIIAALKKNNVVPQLVGDQLRLVGETINLPAELLEEIRNRKEELRTLLKQAMDQHVFAPIPAIARQHDYPASNAQKRIWVLSQLQGGSAAYNIVRSFYLKGIVIKENLNTAFQLAVERHESLRTVFKEVEGELRQIILPEVPFAIDFIDISTHANSREYLRAEVATSVCWQFDLEKGPLLKVKLYRIAAQEYAMIFEVHHIVSDGWSIGVLVQEVMQAYEALCKGEQPLIAPLRIQYKDYCQWHYSSLEGDKGKLAKQFWQNQFTEMPDSLELPADAPRPAVRSFDGAINRFYPDKELFAGILAFCKNHHFTSFNFFRATLTVLLSRLCGQQDVTIGCPASGRTHLDLEDQIGLYVNTLPLRIKVDPEASFLQFVKQVTEHSFKVFEFQDYPFDRIIEDLQVKRNLSRNPLFDVMMAVQDVAIGQGSVNKHKQYGFELSLLDRYLYPQSRQEDEKVPAKFDLTFNLDYEPDNRFYIEIEYDSRLFKEGRINRIFQCYMHVISQVLHDPQRAIQAIEIVPPAEKHIILYKFNDPIDDVEEYSIQQLLQSSFRLHKDKTALVINDTKVSYGHLQNAFNCIADHLIKTADNQPLIGLLMGRSEQMIAGMIGILKSGAAYVPIDITYPPERIAYIIEDAQLSVILADDAGISVVPKGYEGRVIHVNECNSAITIPLNDDLPKDYREHTAYVIYTSGSTGRPKGVEICHRNTIAFLQWARREFATTPYEIAYATTSYCFDLSVFECLFPLLQGKTIRILPSAMTITDWVDRDKKIMINTVPSTVRHLLDEGMAWNNITALNMAGEPVPEHFKQLLDFTHIEIRNLYGPTEDTTYSTVYRFAADGYSTIPIGIPVGYTHVYILDPYLNLMPAGVPGEIIVSGQSVAKGYLNRPALTAEKFINNPFLPGKVMYKTGDIGRWTEEGMLEFIGRLDDQVKIRGHRIEPGEIRFRLQQHPLVTQAVVTVRIIDNENALVAYITGDSSLTISLLKEFLCCSLPSYMVPAYWMILDAFPLNSNGKVDKKLLPHPVLCVDPLSGKSAPSTPLQHRLMELWSQVITVTELGITDNFFDIGGHSLKATKLRFLVSKELGKEITLNEIFAFPTIEKQAQLLESKPSVSVAPIVPAAIADEYPISVAQERLWVLTRFEEASVAYNMPAVYKVNGQLNVSRLQHAFRLVIERYEILRTIFIEKNDMLVQQVLEPGSFNFKVEENDGRHMPAEEGLQWLQSTWRQPFDLAAGPLLRCILLQMQDAQYLSFNMHHIISDGWSLGILYERIAEAYRACGNNTTGHLPWPAVQYKDYAVWQRSQLTGNGMDAHRHFWKELFREEVPVPELPADFNRPAVKTYNGDACQFRFSPSTYKKIQQLSSMANSSVFMTLMAAVRVLLTKYAGVQDIVIGTPVSGRDHAQLQDQIGFYVNTLPIRHQLNSNDGFLHMLCKEKDILLLAFEHQQLSFESLVEELQIKRDVSRSPLFDVTLVLQNADDPGNSTVSILDADVQLERVPVATTVAKYDLAFSFLQQRDELLLTLEYNTDIFSAETIKRMMRHTNRLLEQVTQWPEIAIRDIVLPDEAELAVLCSKADQTHRLFDNNATIISLFQQAAAKFPDNIALVVNDRSFTYRELDTKSGQLAKILIQEYGVATEELIVLNIGRNEWMLIAILGVLKAGAAYVPVDPDYPVARTAYIMEDTAAQLVLCDSIPAQEIGSRFINCTFINIAELEYSGDTAVADIQPAQLAYVIYTSGTTGNPKGALIEHKQVARLLFHEENLFDFNAADKWSLFHSYCFDFSVWEMYGALLYGGTVVMVPKNIARDGRAFYDFLIKEKITVLNQTPTAFRSMLQVNKDRITDAVQVRYLIFGGEALMPAMLAPWRQAVPGCTIVNMYGITETTVHVTYKEITEQEITANTSNIGIPMPTVSCYVLDAGLQQVPIGVTGELCVAGAGVGRGYLKKPDLTATKFVQHPFKVGERMYRSGDYARILANGDIEYIGRRDDQVKIRGHRIELAEVEAAIILQEGIDDAVVLPLKNAHLEYELVAWFIPTGMFQSTGWLRKELQALLPDYMVPSYFIPLNGFPLNSNGKLDKNALPRPQHAGEEQTSYVASRNATDQMILSIWEDVLERKGIGITDNFFDLGGHSLKATRVVSKIHETIGVKIDLKALFVEPTVEHLSNYVDTIRWMEDRKEIPAGNQDEIIF